MWSLCSGPVRALEVSYNHILLSLGFLLSHSLTSLATIFCMVCVMHIKNFGDYEDTCSKMVRELCTTCSPGFDKSGLDLIIDCICTY